jgi:hypothetical protein
MSFKRATLAGSAQLFQPTKVPPREPGQEPGQEEGEPAEMIEEPREFQPQMVTEAMPPSSAQGHLYRLTAEDMEILLEALQHAKFPHSYQRMPKPHMEEFEELEQLRQKLVRQREGRA